MVCASVHSEAPQRGKLLRVFPQVRAELWGELDASAPGRQGGAGRVRGEQREQGGIAKGTIMSSQLAPCTPAPKEACMWVLTCGISSPMLGMHEHLNLDIYSEVQMLAWTIETQ